MLYWRGITGPYRNLGLPGRKNLVAAVALDERFSEAVECLAEHPLMGINGQLAGTRELVPHEHYRLIYELDEERDLVWIVTLIHTARCWPQI